MNAAKHHLAHESALIAILLLGFGLRMVRLGAQSLWYDETVSTYLATETVPAMVAHTAGDIHPPGYYLLLHVWSQLTGRSDMAAAYLSACLGLLLIVLAYWCAVRIFGRTAGVVTALLVATSPFNLWYSQEVRMYTLAAALGMGVLATVLPSLLAKPPAPPSWKRLGAYALLAAAGLWVLYYFAFLLLALNLMILLWSAIGRLRHRLPRAWLGRWILAQIAVLALYSPWLPVVWRQVTSPPVPPWRDFTPFGKVVVETWSALSLGQSVSPVRVWPVLILFALLFAIGLLWRSTDKQDRSHSLLVARRRRVRWSGPSLPAAWWLPVGYVVLPVLLIYLASLFIPLYHVRYTFAFSTPFYAVIGAGLVHVWRRWKAAAWLALAVILIWSGMSVYAYHTDPSYASDDHRSAVAFLSKQWRPGDAILVDAGYVYTAMLHYWNGDPIAWRGRLVVAGDLGSAQASAQSPVLFQAGAVDGSPTLGWDDPESDFYAMSRAETVQALAHLFADADRVWLYRCYDTVTDPQGFIRQWLDLNGVLFEDQVFAGESQLRVQGFLTGRDPMEGHSGGVSEQLADGSLELAGFGIEQSTVDDGSTLDLELIWRVNSPPNDDRILFAGLFDEVDRRWAQTDVKPMGSRLPVYAWPKGELMRTPLRMAVPATMPPGSYRVEVGWYRFVDGRPTWLAWTSGDRFLLGRVNVVPPSDWWALPAPAVQESSGVRIGRALRLIGVDAGQQAVYPGEKVEIELVWQALEASLASVNPVLQLVDERGIVLAESGLTTGDVALDNLAPGQVVRDVRSLTVPAGVPPGAYAVRLDPRSADGRRLSIGRGWWPLGSTYLLVTVQVPGRVVEVLPPVVQFAAEARFGKSIRLVGYSLAWQEDRDAGRGADLELCWQDLETMTNRYKMFVHLVPGGMPADILAQTDLYPRIPTSAWEPGEFLCERLWLDVPSGVSKGRYELVVGWYDEQTGERLPAYGGDGQSLGDSVRLQEIEVDGGSVPAAGQGQ